MTVKKVLVIGGDLRQIYLAEKLASVKEKDILYDVNIYGLEKNVNKVKNVKQIDDLYKVNNVDIIILPMPVLDIYENINTPLSDKIITIKDVLKITSLNTVLFGGKFSENIINTLKDSNIKFFDYLNREELAIYNAIPTAEGAVQIIMEEIPKTIFDSNILIIGSGRISKILRKYLICLGANVVVSARKPQDIAWIKCDKCRAIHNKNIEYELKDKDVIINTVPTKILDKDRLMQIDDDTLIIDLASKPGGVDFQTAKKLSKKTIWALSLPGKVAPITAGHIISDTILNVIEEMGDENE